MYMQSFRFTCAGEAVVGMEGAEEGEEEEMEEEEGREGKDMGLQPLERTGV